MTILPDERHYLKLKAARLYYLENKKHYEISKILGISRPTLNKFLKEALSEGIVKIEIQDIKEYGTFLELESQLRDLLDLQDVRITGSAEDRESPNSLCLIAAQFFSGILKCGMKIGISWGRTMSLMPSYLKLQKDIKDLQFIPMMGGPSSNKSMLSASNSLCDEFAAKFSGSTINYLHAPLLAHDSKTAKLFLQTPDIANVFQTMNELDIALVGVDSDPNHMTFLQTELVSSDFLEELKEKRVAGNICTRFFDIEGNLVKTSIDDRTIVIQAEQLKRIPLVIAVAGGKYKVDSLIGGARSKMFKMLITDEKTAKSIVRKLTLKS